MINLQELENSLTPEQIIELVSNLGCNEYKEVDNAIIFKTICHNENCDDASMKLYYYKSNHRFHCYTDCGCNFNIFELFKKRFELLNINYNFYKDIVLPIANQTNFKFQTDSFYEVYKSDFEKYKKRTIEVNFTPIKESILNIFSDFYTPEWLSDGISKEVMKEFKIKYSIPLNKIIIPHYDIENNLIGIRGRALNKEDLVIGKYMPIQIGETIYSHQLGYNLYGLNKNKDNIKNKKLAIIAESEKSVLQFETMFGRENNIVVASCGSSVSFYQILLLLQAGAERIIIAFDKEGETWMDKEKYWDKLNKLCKKYSNNCIMGFIWDNKNLLNLKDSPFDKGKDVFLKLYREGVVWIK